MTELHEDVVFLFGAGASLSCGPTIYQSGKESFPKTPPLGNGPDGLFARLRAEGGIASTFPQHRQDDFIEDFELGFAATETNQLTFHVAFQRQIALHLASYQVKPGNSFLKLLANPHLRSKRVAYSTLNYDMLLDQAFQAYGFSIEGSPKRSPSHRYFTLLKLHGACNILQSIENDVHGCEFMDCRFGAQGFGGVFPMYIAKNYKEIRAWCDEYKNEQFAPVIAQYVKGKSFISNQAAFQQMQGYWAQLVMGAKLVVVVGVRHVPHDEHIWGPLYDTPARLAIVNRTCKPTLDWGAARKSETFELANSFDTVDAIHQEVAKVLSA